MTISSDVRARIVVKTWEDLEFRESLIQDPRGTLSRMGGEYASLLNETQNIKIITDTPETMHLVLPLNPVETDGLSDSYLEKISQASNGQTMKGPNCATKNYTRPCSRECR
jgi:hypothetical protein